MGKPKTNKRPDFLDGVIKLNGDISLSEALSPSYQKKIVISIESAKTEETLNKRLEKIASDLTNKIKP